MTIQACYDEFAPRYHLVYEDWDEGIARQGAALDALLRENFPGAREILDVAMGIGTQALGLARLGYRVVFLEAVYEHALVHEFALRGISAESQVELPVVYKGTQIGIYKADLVVDSKTIIEIKAVSMLIDAHSAQAIHYLAATGHRLAILLNFGAQSLEFKRIIK